MKLKKRLKDEGWKVIHFWGKEIEYDTVQCVEKIKKVMETR